GITAINEGSVAFDVTFPSVFAATPLVQVTVVVAGGSVVPAPISAIPVDITESGFTVMLSAAAPVGFSLHWHAGTSAMSLSPQAYGIGRLLPDYERLLAAPGEESDVPVIERPARGGRPEL